jgi:hypothetical protein
MYEYTGTFGARVDPDVNIMFLDHPALFLQPVPRERLWITTSMTLLLLVLPLFVFLDQISGICAKRLIR